MRLFSSTYSAYGLFYGNSLKQLRSNNASNASTRNQQQPYLNDRNKNARLLKRRRRITLALGLNIVLNKEHFQVKELLVLKSTKALKLTFENIDETKFFLSKV